MVGAIPDLKKHSRRSRADWIVTIFRITFEQNIGSIIWRSRIRRKIIGKRFLKNATNCRSHVALSSEVASSVVPRNFLPNSSKIRELYRHFIPQTFELTDIRATWARHFFTDRWRSRLSQTRCVRLGDNISNAYIQISFTLDSRPHFSERRKPLESMSVKGQRALPFDIFLFDKYFTR